MSEKHSILRHPAITPHQRGKRVYLPTPPLDFSGYFFGKLMKQVSN